MSVEHNTHDTVPISYYDFVFSLKTALEPQHVAHDYL
jgi:hypothetical protein